jgi:hypothetical protein
MFSPDTIQGFVRIEERCAGESIQVLQNQWFDAGGDSHGTFYEFLLQQDGITVYELPEHETWVIGYI